MFLILKSSIAKLIYQDFLKTHPVLKCPQCGFQAGLLEWIKSRSDLRKLPDGPVAKPEGTKIMIQDLPDDEQVYRIPRAGKFGASTGFGILWTAFSFIFVFVFIFGGAAQRGDIPFFVYGILILFPAIGLGVIYAGLLQNLSKRMLYIGHQTVRIQTDLFGWKKVNDIPTVSVSFVGRMTFYTQNHQPVYGIEINASGRRIRFGSALTDSEQKWLCQEIKDRIKHLHPENKLLS